MFAYAQGYEIDGSDSSYDILTQDRLKCIEILEFLLKLKTVDRNAPFRITLSSKHRPYSLQRFDRESLTIPFPEIDALFARLRTPDITSCTVRYRYQPMNGLFPEIRREIVDLLAMCDPSVKPEQLQRPVFEDDEGATEEFYLALTPEAARYTDESCRDHASGEQYVARVAEGPYFALEVGVALGAPFGSAAYMVKKLAERFPELQIDAGRLIRMLYDYDGYYPCCRQLYERLMPQTADPADTLKRLTATGCVSFVAQKAGYYNGSRTEEVSPERMELVHLPYGLESYDPQPTLEYEFRDAEGRMDPMQSCSSNLNPEWKILKAASHGERIVDIDRYVAFARRLAQVSYFSDSQFAHYTTVWAYIAPEDGEGHSILRFLREKNRISLVIDVPISARERIVKKFVL